MGAEPAHQPATGSVLLRLDTRLFDEDAVLRSAHRFTARCHVHLERLDDRTMGCRLEPIAAGSSLPELAAAFEGELIDQALRSRLRAETDAVRKLILAQTFSKVNLVQPDLDTADPRDDPAGIEAPDPDPRDAQ